MCVGARPCAARPRTPLALAFRVGIPLQRLRRARKCGRSVRACGCGARELRSAAGSLRELTVPALDCVPCRAGPLCRPQHQLPVGACTKSCSGCADSTLTLKRASPLCLLLRPSARPRCAAHRMAAKPNHSHAHTTNTQPPPLCGLPRAHSTPPIAAAEGEAKVNFWENPSDPQSWKEEQFVLTILAAWGVVIYGGMSAFGGGKKDAAPAAVEPTEADGDLEKFMAELEAAEKK